MKETKPPAAEPTSALDMARDAFARRAWKVAFEGFLALDRLAEGGAAEPLSLDDLGRLSLAAGLTGHEDEFFKAMERKYRGELDTGANLAAARSAFWCGFRLMSLGEPGRASAWLTRCQRLVERETTECVEQAYLLVPLMMRELSSGDTSRAYATASQAAAIAERYGDADVLALARNWQGRALVREGRIAEGIALLDESMLAATTGDLSPVITGLIYCGVIASCHMVYALDRAREWTDALSGWCEAQPDLVAFRGVCMVHRAELMMLGGDWEGSVAEVRRVAATRSGKTDPWAAGDAFYQEGEVRRLRGEFDAAESCYKNASQSGREPQPGLSLMRLSQGQTEAAVSGIRRALAESKDPLARARLLPSAVRILLAAGELDDARAACGELEEVAARYQTEVLGALAAHARGVLHLHEGDAQAALGPLRRTFWVWQQIGAPYELARVRVDLAAACTALGDREGAMLALDAARAVFAELGAASDLAALDAPEDPPTVGGPHGLTPRELQVLRLVAAGKTNKAIAKELCLSEKTIDRHVSNIFGKVNVASRAAATAFAYEHHLI